MNAGIDFSQASTIRGLVWVIVAVVGLGLMIAGRSSDIPQLMLLGAGVAGGLGVAVKD